MEHSTTANRRLLAIHNHASGLNPTLGQTESLVVVLPRGDRVTASTVGGEGKTFTQLRLSTTPILTYYVNVGIQLTFEVSSIGTKYDGETAHIPKYSIVEVAALNEANETPKDVIIPRFWAAIYALFTLYYTQEYIPLALTSVANEGELRGYLLTSGLGRLSQGGKKAGLHENIIFLSNAAFWQGAGTTGYHENSWLLSPRPIFPRIPSFTRSEMVIASHPLRPPKPAEGEVLYRRYCAAIGQTLEIIAFDLHGAGGKGGPHDGPSPHLVNFHKWHNDERINSAWGEGGSIEEHRKYIEGLLADPGVVPCMMSWDGELMGYTEIFYLKENHCAQYYPPDLIVGDWERGMHVLVGESKFLGAGRSEVWLRSLAHYVFLADPRTERVIGEPNKSNMAMTKLGLKSGFHIHTTIDFPYKRSVLMPAPRERFFKSSRLY